MTHRETIQSLITPYIGEETKVLPKFLHYILSDPKYGSINQTNNKKSIEAIQGVIDLYKDWLDTGIKPSEDLWLKARELAWKADAYAAAAAAVMKVSNHHGSYEISYANTNDTQFYYSNRSDFPTITKILGNKHQNPELMELVKNNPQPFPEEDKVEFIDFSLPETDTLELDRMTNHLIQQELQMFRMIGTSITQDDVDWLSKRRGFNVNVKNFFIRILRMDPLGKDLQFDTTHESIKK